MSFPERGKIYRAKIPGQPGDTKDRPVLIVSGDSRNQFAHDVIIVPLSTTLQSSPTHFRLPARAGGLTQDSMAKCEQVTTIDKIFITSGPLGGAITPAQMREVEKAVMRAVGIVVP
jgi:mRNA-degrading endonuclease toxin of MazEF toxin-antitoxin module